MSVRKKISMRRMVQNTIEQEIARDLEIIKIDDEFIEVFYQTEPIGGATRRKKDFNFSFSFSMEGINKIKEDDLENIIKINVIEELFEKVINDNFK